MPIDFPYLQALKDYFYPPIPEPVPVQPPVSVQPEEEIKTQYSVWVMGGMAIAAIVATIGLNFFYRTTSREEMFKACRLGNGDAVDKLLKRGFDPNTRNSYDQSPLEIAIEQSHSRIIALLIPKVDLNAPNKAGECPLHHAAKKGDTDLITLLVEKGARITVLDKLGKTPLQHAIENTRSAAITVLLMYNAKAPISADYANSLFEIAGNTGNKEILPLLVDKIDVKKVNALGETPLHFAAKCEDEEIAKKFIEKGANVNAVTKKKETPLYYAVVNNKAEAAKTLLSKGADEGLVPGGIRLLDIAIDARSEDVFPLLLKKEDVTKKTSFDETLLHFVAEKGTSKMIKTMVDDMGASVNATTVGKKTPLHFATVAGNADGVAALLQHKADPDLATDKGFSPLHVACQKGHTKIITALLDAGANPNVLAGVGSIKFTPLYFAVKGNNPEVVKALLQHKIMNQKKAVNPNIEPGVNESPLHIARKNGAIEIMVALLEAGANPNALAGIGSEISTSLLSFAVQGNYTKAVHVLLLNMTTAEGITPLHMACRDYVTFKDQAAKADAQTEIDKARTQMNKSIEFIKLLLAAKADINAQGRVEQFEYTPLEYANNDPEIKELLFQVAK